MKRKGDYYVIALGGILIIIVSLIAIITTNYSESPNNDGENTPPLPTNSANDSITPTEVDLTQTRPPLLYDKADDEKLLDLIKNRRPITNADALAKSKILTLLPPDTVSGIVHETRNIRIDYTQSADLFQVEILTTDINAAKSEANVWFREQGLSQNAICTLPVSFYVSYDVANQLRSTDIVVSSLGNGC